MKRQKLLVLGLAAYLLVHLNLTFAVEQFPIEHFFKRPEIQNVVISPDGLHAAGIIPAEKQKVVAILDINDPKKAHVIQTLTPPAHEDAAQVFWVNNERLAFTTSEKQTSLTVPRGTGKFYAADIDGKRKKVLAGEGSGRNWTFLFGVVSTLRDDPKRIVVISRSPGDRKLKAEYLNVVTGKTNVIGWSPMVRADGLVLDHDQKIRFATGVTEDDYRQKVMYKAPDGEWEDFKHPFAGNIRIFGFDEDNKNAWIGSRDLEQFGLYRFNTETGEYHQILTDEVAEVFDVVWDRAGKNIIGAEFRPDYPVYKYVDELHPDARIQRSIEAGFPGQYVSIGAFSNNGHRTTVQTSTANNPGVIYLYDDSNHSLTHISPRLPWIDPDTMAEMEPFQVTARDGTQLHGYLTMPRGVEPKNLPMVVIVHGGPHGPRDHWSWDPEAQLYANRGYLVMQVNYRGSGGYGYQFEQAGFKKWGVEMQDDVTDATLWAVNKGLADRNRICLSGASYGGYATLAGITREPDLYRCSFAYVGVYDLKLMFSSGDIARTKNGQAFLRDALGTDDTDLAARSPITHVSKIKTPLFLVHGKKDDRADVKHYYALTKALDQAGISYTKLLTDKEAHGFYDLSNQKELYGMVLEFFGRHLKGQGLSQN